MKQIEIIEPKNFIGKMLNQLAGDKTKMQYSFNASVMPLQQKQNYAQGDLDVTSNFQVLPEPAIQEGMIQTGMRKKKSSHSKTKRTSKKKDCGCK